jgi:hypothetical protein
MCLVSFSYISFVHIFFFNKKKSCFIDSIVDLHVSYIEICKKIKANILVLRSPESHINGATNHILNSSLDNFAYVLIFFFFSNNYIVVIFLYAIC